MISYQIAIAYLRFSIKDGTIHNFDQDAFFNQVFRHNCDIHGFLYSYYDATLSHNRLDRNIRKDIRKVLVKYLFSIDYADKRFPVREIISDLGSIIKVPTPSPSPSPTRQTNKTVKRKQTPFRASQLRVETGRSDAALTELLSLETGRKRCPKGTRRDKKTGKCKRIEKAASRAIKAASHAKPADVLTLSPTRKRCPRGYRIDKKTRKCHRIRK